MSVQFHLIVVGKYKNTHLESLEFDYLKRITSPRLNIHEVKAIAEKPEIELVNIQKKIEDLSKNSRIILLDEKGKQRTSHQFSEWIGHLSQNPSDCIFVIGGAQGHQECLKNKAHELFSLSNLTLPHKLARLFFIEQFYRAQTIINGHPYHN